MNGKMRWIFTLTGFIFILLTTAFGYTWNSVAENRRDIQKNKEIFGEIKSDVAVIKTEVLWIKEKLK